MFGRVPFLPRLTAIIAIALACPHPVSFREGGYLPVAVVLTILGDEPAGGLVMLAFCLALYCIPLLAPSFAVFGHAAAATPATELRRTRRTSTRSGSERASHCRVPAIGGRVAIC